MTWWRRQDHWGGGEFDPVCAKARLRKRRSAMLAQFAQLRADVRGAASERAQERSVLCPGFCVPPYVALALPAKARAQLYRRTLPTRARVETGHAQSLRFFFENGLEIRILQGRMLEVRALYHAHPWLIRKRPARHQPGYPMRGMFEDRQETLSASLQGWEQISDPEISHHARLAAFAARQGSGSGDLAQAEVFDASACAEIHVVTTTTTIVIGRNHTGGFGWRAEALGAHRGQVKTTPIAPMTIRRGQERLRDAARWSDLCLAALPVRQREALRFAARFGPLLTLTEAGWTHLIDRARRAIHDLKGKLST